MGRSVVPSPLNPYLEAADRGDPLKAAAAFAENAIYVRPGAAIPGSPPLSDVEVIVGRSDILASFQRRKDVGVHHYIRSSVVEGNRCFVEGDVKFDAADRSDMIFMATATLDDEGLIAWYLAIATALSPEKATAVEASRIE
jgi:SnoaL-like domain